MKKTVFLFFILIISICIFNPIQLNATSQQDADINEVDSIPGFDNNGNLIYHKKEAFKNFSYFSNKKTYSLNNSIVDFYSKASSTEVVTYTNYYSGKSGYLNGFCASDAAFLGFDENGNVIFKVAGVVGIVDSSKANIVDFSDVKSISHYEVYNNKLYHYIAKNLYMEEDYLSINYIGPSPSYMNINQIYYSYDGHYFYTDYKTMISDYINNTYVNSVNSSNPYFNYYQYLPSRSKTKLRASQLDTFTASKVSTGKMLNHGVDFITNQDKYGVNALLMYANAVLESGWGTSQIAMDKNNLFGHGAVDSNPYYGANGYETVGDCITYHAKIFISEGYCDAKDAMGRYYGSHLGDKESGINVKYASDPYWGEKIAVLCWQADSYYESIDSYNYNISVKISNNNINIYSDLGKLVLYDTGEFSFYPVIILENEGNYLKIQSDTTLNSSRTAIIQDQGEYDYSLNYAYVLNSDFNENTVEKIVNQWIQDKNGNYYWYDENGNKTIGWKYINDNWYYFDSQGIMQKGWLKYSNRWYYLSDNGYMLTGFQNIEGKTYYFASDGIMQTGWQKIENDTYFFCGDGNMYTGWLKQNNHYYYFIKNGAMLKGLNTVDGVSYYFDESGIMRTGWIKISNQYYYFNGSGAMVKNQWIGNYYLLSTGIMATNQWIGNYYVGADGAWIPNAPVTKWVKEGNNWKYLNTKTNTYSTSKWEKINNVWYYFNEESIMVTGLNTIEGKDYYFNTSGAMVTGWGKLNNKWYYFQASGAMAKSQWIQDYYLKENGEMATNEIVGIYYVDSTGAYVKSKWVLIGEDYYYFDGSGKMVKNKWIGDYYLGSDGKMARDTWIGVYYVDENGKWIPGKK